MASLNFFKGPIEALTPTKRGSRACYRLETTREYLHEKQWKRHDESSASRDAKIRRWRYGKENRNNVTKTILLVGETGSGKTTLLNTIVNYMIGVKFENKAWYEITEEDNKNQSVSQTSAVTVYEIHVETKLISLTIIDTPGYGDTKGVDHDKTIAGSLRELFESYRGIDRIDAVGLVIKASQNRVTDVQRYIFESVLSLFGKDIEDNIVLLITHSDGLPPTGALDAIKNADTRCAKDKDGEPIHFLFNNRQNQPHKEHQAKTFKRIWSSGEESIEDLFKFLQRVKGQSLRMTGDVLKKRIHLEAILRDLFITINLVDEDEKEVEHINCTMEENKAKLDNDETFAYVAKETKMKKVPIRAHFKVCYEKATCCDVCKKNCHFPGCTWVDNPYWCTVMSGGICRVCGCSYTDHTKEDKLYMPVTEDVEKTNEDLKREIQDVYEKHVDMQEKIEKKLTENRQRMSQLLDEAYKGIIELDEIALHQESLNIHVDFDILITKLSETSQTEKVLKLKEIKDRAPADKYSSQWDLRGNFKK
ncbi:uncharacterized protein LOC134060388 [Sardina pilchardus]|uniref:uncharacterized protein LOC134060388 n=1 Tax=Sardina pilchardus TaxID=27697 RepID=UPI002E13563B